MDALLSPQADKYFSALRRWFLLLILCPLVAAVVAAYVSYQLPPVYQSQVSLLVRPVQPLVADPNTVALSSDQITATYATLMTERPLLQKVMSDLNLTGSPTDLASEIAVTPRSGTTIIDVTVNDTQPDRAEAIGNTLVQDFINSEKQIQQQESSAPNSRTSDNFVVVSPAIASSTPVAPKKTQNVVLAFVAGLLLALVIVFLSVFLDRTVKDDQELQERTGLVPLSHVPFAARRRRTGELVSLERTSPAYEAYRRLRTNVVFANGSDEIKSLVVTSPSAQDGKSRTAANLAVVLASAGHRTLLLDADFRRPSLHKIFKLESGAGLVNLVLNDSEDAKLLQTVENVPNLWVVPAGPPPPNPSELLGSQRMEELIERFREHFQFIVIDTPPVNSATDAAVLSPSVDGTILVIEHGRTSYPALVHAQESLDMVGAKVLGVVMNKVRRRDAYYSNYYSRYHASAPTGEKAS